MGSSLKVVALLFVAVVVVLVPSLAFGRNFDFDGLAPALAPFYDNLCDTITCGKGTCKAQNSVTFFYECECEPGWKRTLNDQVNDYLKFLPCIYPECTFDFSISQPAPPPLPEIRISFNVTDFDPCSFTSCGAGMCKNKSSYQHTCECNTGYKNLLNVSYFPCYNTSSLGSDCKSLGLEASNEKVNTNGANKGKFHWMTIFVISVAMALRK
ncbi:Neurogenic locus notch-like protein [Melia azedarach]|uniref:Neurogenic locus notch-like protein n=1 Tax=Melia azedarach TaxID=155640 RepID=A0ACC1Y890_MELAZ|nr:Neurogenic locus notch-like protein [Melia azedarach]